MTSRLLQLHGCFVRVHIQPSLAFELLYFLCMHSSRVPKYLITPARTAQNGAAVLQAEVSMAKHVHRRWETKSHALQRLEAEVASARRPLDLPALLNPGGSEHESLGADFKQRIKSLEHAIVCATEAEIPVGGARKVQQEMRAQLFAAQTAVKLEDLMASRPCSSASLKASLKHPVSISDARVTFCSTLILLTP